ncbi:uncharacterized protein TRAVEDRAFT_48050 [Trametes versicolor FP-101664 SS1]|uniref:uncharacterized protein n=1 Tax=Trametes versicolor (strain FP-101664) TaxID=717944 RepID=UPI0004621D01|nr:uncharacterized protein TRAVEDRAFT_48050 [Trametes versicolor FP-101664 SS1]EIW58908.1 hypothetical protein TRAVEDRAFT_48050 [Trametes versicolor FP-101664 SS1]
MQDELTLSTEEQTTCRKARPVVPLTDVPVTRGLTPAQIGAMRNQPDPDLEELKQPLSAWYCRWKCRSPAAGEFQLGDDADFNEVDCPFPDPIAARGHDMTANGEQEESYRLTRSAGLSSDRRDAALAVFHESTRRLGHWAGTAISSVIQAHNLRWMAAVEFDHASISYLKAVWKLYSLPQLQRAAGIRYLLAASPADHITLKQGRPSRPETYWPTLSNNTFPYPAATASKRTVSVYYWNIPTSNWSMGLRLVDGTMPRKDTFTFGDPSPDDAYGAFLAKHLRTIPKTERAESTKLHGASICQNLVALFSVPGLYRHICELGGYFVHPRRVVAAYPFKDTNITLLAAWLAEFGLGDMDPYILYFERWARLSRERMPDQSRTHALPFDTVEEFSASPLALQVVGRETIQWGPRVFESPDFPSTRVFVPDSDGTTSEPSVGQPRSPVASRASSSRALQRPADDKEDAISFGSDDSDDKFADRAVLGGASSAKTSPSPLKPGSCPDSEGLAKSVLGIEEELRQKEEEEDVNEMMFTFDKFKQKSSQMLINASAQ